MSTKITYNDTTIELNNGYKAILPCEGYKMTTDVIVEASDAEIMEWDGDNVIATTVSTEDPLIGVWEFSWAFGEGSKSWTVDFISNGTSYHQITVEGHADGDNGINLMYDDTLVANDLFGGWADWMNEAYQIIIITSYLDDVENGNELLAWLETYAVKS